MTFLIIVFLTPGVLIIIFSKQLSKMIVDHQERLKKMGVTPKFMQSKKSIKERINYYAWYTRGLGVVFVIASLQTYLKLR